MIKEICKIGDNKELRELLGFLNFCGSSPTLIQTAKGLTLYCNTSCDTKHEKVCCFVCTEIDCGYSCDILRLKDSLKSLMAWEVVKNMVKTGKLTPSVNT